MEAKKRKRPEVEDGDDAVSSPRITYHANGRTFDRLFKEASLEETKNLVRKKLRLPPKIDVQLEQIRDGKLIDLEDAEDFAAFRARAHDVLSLEVKVSVGNGVSTIALPSPIPNHVPSADNILSVSQSLPPPSPGPSNGGELKKRKKRKSLLGSGALSEPQSESLPSSSAIKPKSRASKRKATTEEPETTATSVEATKKRKTNNGDATTVAAVCANGVEKKETANLTKKKDVNGKAKEVFDSVELVIPKTKTPKSQAKGTGPKPASAEEPLTPAITGLLDAGSKKGKEKTVGQGKAEKPSTGDDAEAKSTADVRKKGKKIKDKAPFTGKESSETGPSLSAATSSWLASLDPDPERAIVAIKALPSAPELRKKKRTKSVSESGAAANTEEEPIVADTLKDAGSKGGKKTKKPAAKALQVGEKKQEVEKKTKKTKVLEATSMKTSQLDAAPDLGKKGKGREIEPVVAPESEVLSLDEAEPNPKKRRKDTSNGDLSSVQSTNSVERKKLTAKKSRAAAEIPSPIDIDEVTPAAPAVQKKQKGRPPRPSLTLDPEMEARINEDMEAFMARKSPIAAASTQPPLSPKELQANALTMAERADLVDMADVTIPSTRKRSPSRLRQSWGPDDVDDEVEVTPEPDSDSSSDSEPVTLVKVNARRPIVAQPPSDISISRGSSPAGRKMRDSDNMPCPVCLGTPFHLRYRCPVIVAGPEAIEKRLQELKLDKLQSHSGLIQELEQIIQTKKARAGLAKSSAFSPPPVPLPETSKPSMSTKEVVKETVSPPSLPSRKPTIPTGSKMSEVTVEQGDEGSSNEGSDSEGTTSSSSSSSDDEDSEDEEHGHTRQPKLSSAFPGIRSLNDVDLDALIRGPASQSKSVLDDIPSRSNSDKEEDEVVEDDAEDEEDEDEQQLRKLSKKARQVASSDEGEGEDPDAQIAEANLSGDTGALQDVPAVEPAITTAQPAAGTLGTTEEADGSAGSAGTDGEKTDVEPSVGAGEETNETAKPGEDDVDVEAGNDLVKASPQVATLPRSPGLAKRMRPRGRPVSPSPPTSVDLQWPPSPPQSVKADVKSKSPKRDPSEPGTQPKSPERVSPDAMPPPSSAPKKRGRPPLPAEEKAARGKARLDEKNRKAEERARKAAAKKVGVKGSKSTPQSSQNPPASQPITPSPAAAVRGEPQSLDKWAALVTQSSPEVPDASLMVDELRSSSPPPATAPQPPTSPTPLPENEQLDSADATAKPLFELSSSQVPFPYSQFQGATLASQAEDSPTESESEDEVPKMTPRITSSATPKYRRLTDIASQAMFSSQDIMSPITFTSTPIPNGNSKAAVEESDDEDDEEDDDSGSDSDADGKSHIPKSRRAGAKLKPKKAGLLSFA